MNKKGFTLIEIVTVIAILSICVVVMMPKINSAFKESKADQLEDVRKNIVDSTDIYLRNVCGKNTYDKLIRNDEVKIYLNVIADCGLLEDKIYNPMSGDYFDIDNEFIIVKIDEVGMIDYEFSF